MVLTFNGNSDYLFLPVTLSKIFTIEIINEDLNLELSHKLLDLSYYQEQIKLEIISI